MYFGGFLRRSNLITTGKHYDRGKKRYSHLAVGWNKSQITVKYEHQLSPEKITTGKKRYHTVVWPSVGIRVKIRTPTTV